MERMGPTSVLVVTVLGYMLVEGITLITKPLNVLSQCVIYLMGHQEQLLPSRRGLGVVSSFGSIITFDCYAKMNDF